MTTRGTTDSFRFRRTDRTPSHHRGRTRGAPRLAPARPDRPPRRTRQLGRGDAIKGTVCYNPPSGAVTRKQDHEDTQVSYRKSIKRVSCIGSGKRVTLYKKKPSKRSRRRKRAKQVWKDLCKGKRM